MGAPPPDPPLYLIGWRRGNVVLVAGSSLVVWPDGGFENATRRLANAEELLGTRTAKDSIGGTSTWTWTLTAFD